MGQQKNKMWLLNLALRFSIKYRVVAYTALEFMWIQSLLCEMDVIYKKANGDILWQSNYMYISNNPIFHEWTKHIKVDCHFTRDMVITSNSDYISHIYGCQFCDIFTKALSRKSFFIFLSNLDMIDIYTPVWE